MAEWINGDNLLSDELFFTRYYLDSDNKLQSESVPRSEQGYFNYKISKVKKYLKDNKYNDLELFVNSTEFSLLTPEIPKKEEISALKPYINDKGWFEGKSKSGHLVDKDIYTFAENEKQLEDYKMSEIDNPDNSYNFPAHKDPVVYKQLLTDIIEAQSEYNETKRNDFILKHGNNDSSKSYLQFKDGSENVLEWDDITEQCNNDTTDESDTNIEIKEKKVEEVKEVDDDFLVGKTMEKINYENQYPKLVYNTNLIDEVKNLKSMVTDILSKSKEITKDIFIVKDVENNGGK